MLQEKNASVTIPKVMIVEDEAIIARDIQMQLERQGFAVVGIASTAAGAMRAIEEQRPDIVLMDIRLKGEMDGVEAADIIRNNYALPVVYLTAHTDEATIERAQLTEPFGYLVKPLGNTNIKAMLMMALYKHRTERELENHRKLVSTILQGLPDAVLVAHPSGEILFLNQAAERLTGWSHQDAIGKSLLQVAQIQNIDAHLISGELLQQAIAQGTPVRIPRDSVLVGNGLETEISGQLAVAAVGNRPAGVFITLQDATVQKREDQRLRQEQQMFVAGELAHGVAREFYALFDLIEGAAETLAERQPSNANTHELDLIGKTSQIGTRMSTQLLELREGHGAAHVVNLNEYILKSQFILERLCGDAIRLDIAAEPDLGYVLSTGNHMEQMLMHLVLEGKQRVNGRGALSIRADVHTQPISYRRSGSYVRLSLRAEEPAAQDPEGPQVALAAESPELGLALVRAMAIASEGFVRVTEPTDSLSEIEVFLPRHEARIDATAAANEYPNVMLLVGLQLRFAESLQNAMGESVLLLEAASLDEAALVSEMYNGDIDLILLNESRFPPKARDRACDRIRAGRPTVAFLELASPSGTAGMGTLNSSELERRVRDFFLSRTSLRAIAATR